MEPQLVTPQRVGIGMFRPYLDRTIDDGLPTRIQFVLAAVEAQGMDPDDWWAAIGGKRRLPPDDPFPLTEVIP